MIEIDVRKRLGPFELQAVFRSKASVTALFGHSGAGKTTLIRMIGGLLKPDAGVIKLNGKLLFDSNRRINVPAHKRRLGHVFQQGHLFPHLSVKSNLLYGCRFRGKGTHDQFDQVVTLLDLQRLLSRWPQSLSGGEQQRVAIGRALLSQPVCLLMDEPLASLDSGLKREIMPYFERLCHESRVPILYVSHSVDEVTRLAEDMVLLSNGRVAGHGSIADIMSRLDLWPLTGRFEAGAVLQAVVENHDLNYGLTYLQLGEQSLVIPYTAVTPGQSVRLRIRSRDVSIALGKPPDVSIQNILPGRISELNRESGTFLEVRIDIGGQYLSARVTRQAGDRLGLAAGTPVYALVKSVALDRATAQAFQERTSTN